MFWPIRAVKTGDKLGQCTELSLISPRRCGRDVAFHSLMAPFDTRLQTCWHWPRLAFPVQRFHQTRCRQANLKDHRPDNRKIPSPGLVDRQAQPRGKCQENPISAIRRDAHDSICGDRCRAYRYVENAQKHQARRQSSPRLMIGDTKDTAIPTVAGLAVMCMVEPAPWHYPIDSFC